jgi:hypothetical protein
MRDDARHDEAPAASRTDEQDDASRQAKAKKRAAAGDHERGLAPEPDPQPQTPSPLADASGDVKGDPAP